MNDLLKPSEKRATLQDIARLTGVSVATVSGAFSGNRRMSVHTREAVLSTARDLGFELNPHAQRLRAGGCSNTIGLLSENDLGVATLTTSELRFRLDERGFQVDDHLIPLYLQQVETRQTELLRQMCRQNPRAILFSNVGLEPGAFDILKQYMKGGGVLVYWALMRTDSTSQNLEADHVFIDTEEERYLQARHLIDLGHREIGYFSHGGEFESGPHLNGFKRACAEAKIEVRPEWMWSNYGYEDAGIKHAERFLALRERPTGVCIVNDNAAAAFVHRVMRSGLQVPRDISVIGCDDTAAARGAFVPLTTMRRPIEELSHAVIQLLCDRLDGTLQGPPVTREIKTQLIMRSSTAAPYMT